MTLERDGYGWMTRISEKGKVTSNRWIEGLNATTGLEAYQNLLYVADRVVLIEIDISKGKLFKI